MGRSTVGGQSRPRETAVQGLHSRCGWTPLGNRAIRKVHLKFFVGTAAFPIGRNAISAPNDRLAMQRAWRPCEADARLPVPYAEIIVIERLGIAGRSRRLDLSCK